MTYIEDQQPEEISVEHVSKIPVVTDLLKEVCWRGRMHERFIRLDIVHCKSISF